MYAAPIQRLIAELDGAIRQLGGADFARRIRVRGPEDLQSIGWEEMLGSNDVIIAIEWPSRIQSELPALRLDVSLSHTGPHSRMISINAPSELESRL